MWGIVESYNNLTPRGLENPVSSSEPTMEILDSFLLPKRNDNSNDSQFEYMIFVWNGKTANAALKSLALSNAFELETIINKCGEVLLQVNSLIKRNLISFFKKKI